jgi:magnesium transporter
MTIHVLVYERGRSQELENPEDISELIGEPGRALWVDLDDPTDEDFELVQDEFSLHPLAMEDARHHNQRAKLEHYPTHAFIVAYSADLSEVDMFIGPTWVVTVRGKNADGQQWKIGAVEARIERTCPHEPTVGFLVYSILDELVDGYFDALDASEDTLELLEDRIFAERMAEERIVQQRLFNIRRGLVVFRRAVYPLREVLSSLLRREVEWIDDATVVHLQDVYDHVLRAIDLLDSQRELMGNAVDAHLAIVSNHMNEVMKKMTSWGAILLGSTLVAGIYGMNFVHMPELKWRYGYAYAIGIMGFITVVGYWYFSRKDWL